MTLMSLVFVALAAAPAQGAQPADVASRTPAPALDARFAPWLGCWKLDDRADGAVDVARMCVVAGADAGVRMLTIVGDRVANEEAVAPDGVARDVRDPDCRGSERAAWAATFQGFFRKADVTCGGTARQVAGIVFMAPGPSLVDVQAIDTDARGAVRVRRYVRAANQSLPASVGASAASARAMALSDASIRPWTIDSVIEASRALPTDAVQAAVSELDRPFDLKARQLAALADASVDERIIDLMLAQAYPERFVVRRASAGGGGGLSVPWVAPDDFELWMGMCDPFYGLVSSPCMATGLYRSFWYDHQAFSYYGYRYGYDPSYNYGWVPVGPGGPATGPPVTRGRVVNGMGYTRVDVRPPATAMGPSSGRGDPGTSSSTASTGSNAGVSSQGYSSGGASAGSDRTAQPRPPR